MVGHWKLLLQTKMYLFNTTCKLALYLKSTSCQQVVYPPYKWNGDLIMNVDEDALAKVVGKAISKRRMTCNLTQEQVAERLNVGNRLYLVWRGVQLCLLLQGW